MGIAWPPLHWLLRPSCAPTSWWRCCQQTWQWCSVAQDVGLLQCRLAQACRCAPSHCSQLILWGKLSVNTGLSLTRVHLPHSGIFHCSCGGHTTRNLNLVQLWQLPNGWDPERLSQSDGSSKGKDVVLDQEEHLSSRRRGMWLPPDWFRASWNAPKSLWAPRMAIVNSHKNLFKAR